LNPTLAQLVEHMIVAHVVVGSYRTGIIVKNRIRCSDSIFNDTNPASRIRKATDNKKVSPFYYLFIVLLL